MVNTNVQSPVPLVGRGFTRRASQQYGPGEFYQLDNVFITDRGMQSRYGIGFIKSDFYSNDLLNDSKYYQDQSGFIGSHSSFFGTELFVVGNTTLFSIDSSEETGHIYWTPTALNGGVAPTNMAFETPVKAFSYQDVNYFIIMKAYKNPMIDAIATIEYYLGVQGINKAVLPTRTLIATRSVNSSIEKDFVDSFIWKDRVWLITKDTVYFSGVGKTKHIVPSWPTPDGGFIKYTGQIKTVQFVRDTLYVMCENEVYSFNYNADPNQDATNIRISDRGADSSCIHDGTVYATDGDALFTVNGSSMDKVLDLELFNRYPVPNLNGWSSLTASQIQTKMVSYKNKIVLIYHDVGTFGFSPTSNTPMVNRGIKLPADTNTLSNLALNQNDEIISDPFNNFNNTFMIDMDNGSITRIQFNDIRHDPDEVYGSTGAIVDATVRYDSSGTPCLYLMTSCHRGAAGAGTTWNFVYKYLDQPTNWRPDIDAVGAPVLDSYQTFPDGINRSQVTNYAVPFTLVLNKFVPDGSEYLMKKFRTLLLEGNLPEFTKYGFFYDRNLPELIEVPTPDANQRRPKSYRLGLMQRGRSISIVISRNAQAITSGVLSNTDVLTLEDMRLYWTYTGKPQRTIGGQHSALAGGDL